jgi:hypothetical protein
MNRRPNPIDDAFRSKLAHYAADPPTHLWEGIARQRNLRRILYSRRRERTLLAAALLLFVYASVLTWYLQQIPPTLSHFPVAAGASAPLQKPTGNPSNSTAIAINSTSNKSANQKLQVVDQLPNPLGSVESLTVQLAETLENWSEENPFHPSVTALSALQVSALPLALQQLTQEPPVFFDQSKCAAFTDHKPRFFFDVLASPDVTFRRIQPRTKDDKTYADSRRKTEEGRYNYSVGLRFSAVSKGGLAFRAGVNYSEINERFELPTNTRIVITYDPDGNIIGSPDTIVEKFVTNNRYQTLDLPVMLGYEIALKKWTLALNGGAYINVHFKPKGEFLSPYDANRPVTFSNTEDTENQQPPAFRENLGVGWYGSLGVQYRLSPRLQVLLEPHVRAYPHSFTRDDFVTQQKYLTAGVTVGLRHQFAL